MIFYLYILCDILIQLKHNKFISYVYILLNLIFLFLFFHFFGADTNKNIICFIFKKIFVLIGKTHPQRFYFVPTPPTISHQATTVASHGRKQNPQQKGIKRYQNPTTVKTRGKKKKKV